MFWFYNKIYIFYIKEKSFLRVLIDLSAVNQYSLNNNAIKWTSNKIFDRFVLIYKNAIVSIFIKRI